MNKPQDPEAAETVQTRNVPAVDLPRLVRNSPREWWIAHSCGAWFVGVGDEIGHIGIKTQSMGCSYTHRMALWDGPAEKVKELIRLNIEQLGPPLKPRSRGASTSIANADAQATPASAPRS
jgi:hypothetical protein